MKRCRHALLATGSIALVATAFLSLCLRDQLRGDLAVQTLIHLRDFSVYFWGQDRYFSLVPLLLLWNQDAETGLYLTAALNAISFFAVPYLLLEALDNTQVDNKNRTLDSALLKRLITLAVFACVITLTWSQEELYFFVKDASPFPLSTALGFLSVFLWCRPAQEAKIPRTRHRLPRIASGVLILLSLLVAPTTAGLSAAFLMVVLATRASQSGQQAKIWKLGKEAMKYLSACLFAYLIIQAGDVALRIPKLTSYSQSSGIGLIPSAMQSLHAIWAERTNAGNNRWLSLIPFLTLPLAGLRLSKGCINIMPASRNAIAINPLTLLWTYAGIALLVFSSLKWVAQNGYHFRYQYPLYVAWSASTLTAINATWQVAFERISHLHLKIINQVAIAVAIAAFGLSLLLRPTLNEAATVRKALAAYQWMEEQHVTVIGGDYWSSWPLYLWSQRTGSTWPLESVAHRSSSNFASHDRIRAQSAKRFLAGSPVPMACMGTANVQTCISQYKEVVGNQTTIQFASKEGNDLPADVAFITFFK